MLKNQHSSSLLLVLATLVFPGARPAGADILPADRMTVWRPGVPGGIPNRTAVCATVAPPAGDATATIQAAINACPVGQVVQLTAGTFTINNDIVYVNKGITLRGAGASATLLQRTNGATQGSYFPGVAKPVIIVGPARWGSGETGYNLAADGAKGAMSVQLATAPSSFSPGQIVLVDELSNASWQADPGGRGQIWAAPDWRVVYQRHNPGLGTDDPFPAAAGWFCRQDRPTAEVKEVASYDATTKTVTFTSPLHISYRATQGAQLSVYAAQNTHVKYAGVEDLKVTGGDDGQIRFLFAAYSWAARVENTAWLGEGFAINYSYRVEVRDSYVHTPVWFEPGGGSYNISLANGSAEVLIENNISTDANKVMVARCSGAGSVVGYNYMDDGRIGSNPSWVEVGLNASHMVGPHHVLFEGNWGFNFDSDKTHGNSIYHTVFRNWLTGKRTHATNGGPKRAAGVAFYGYWMSFVGNVMGVPGGMSGWSYESTSMSTPAIWLLGWDDWAPYPSDPKVKATVLREGNFDYLTNLVHWDTTAQALPLSLYLASKPAFFGNNTWPWVDPVGATKLYTLPAKARYDAGQPIPPPPPPPGTYTLAVTKAGTGGGTVTSSPTGISCGATCSASYASGTVVTLSQGATTGSSFAGWSGACTGTGSCQVTMSAAQSVTATFNLNPVTYSLTVAKAGTGSGTVTSSPAGISCGATCSAAYNSGTVVTLSQAATAGSSFAGWSGACTGTGSCQVTMSAAQSVTATFNLIPYTLTVANAGTGSGTVTSSPAGINCGADCSEPYAAGTPVTLSATPAPGSEFVSWNGACGGTAVTCDLTMNGPRSATASFAPVGESVTWEHLLGTQVQGATLQRPSGSGWNAGAVSNRVLLSGDGFGEYRVSGASSYAMFGLSHGDTDGTYADIDYALYTYAATGVLMVYEKGVGRGTFGTYAPGDALRVSVEGGAVTYRKNGQLLYTSGAVPTYPLLVDVSVYSTASQITDAFVAGQLGDLATPGVLWRNLARVQAEGSTLRREATTGWNGGASSTQELASGDGYAEYRVSDLANCLMFGLSHGDADQSYGDIDYAVYTYPVTGKVMVYEQGQYRATLATVGGYAVGDLLRVGIEGGVVTYSVNGVPLYTSSTPPTYPLVADTSLYSANAVIADARMGGDILEVVTWTQLTDVAVVGDALTRPVAGGWTAGAISSRRIATGNGGAEYAVADTASYVMFGLSHGNTDESYGDIDYALYTYPPTGQVMVFENGVFRGQFGAYAVGDRLKVRVQEGVVSYWKNGGLLYTSLAAPTYPLILDVSLYAGRIEGARLTGNVSSVPVIEESVAWTNLVNVSDSAGRLQRPTGSGWNAGAVSTQTLSGDGYVEYPVSSLSDYVMLGLGTGDTDQGYADIEYAIYTYPATGYLFIYEGGVYRAGGGTYAVGDKLRVAVEGGVVKYRKNGVLVYSSTVPPTYPLNVDTSLYSTGATVSGAKIGRGE